MRSKNKIIIVGCLLIFLVLLSLVYFFIPKIEINLNGYTNITLLVGEEYVEQNATAELKTFFKKKDLKVDIAGSVNTNKIGRYVITYKTKANALKKEKIRIVTVIDNIKPELSIEGTVLGCKKNNLIEYNATATDNYDNDITNKIKYKITDDEILFSVVDSSNNQTTETQKIKFIDAEKPIIELTGKKNLYLLVGNEYEEYGASAFDSCDGDISSNIIIEHNIDVNTPNTYEVKYTVSDNSNNTTTSIRYVTVINQNDKIDEEYKVINGATIYLTFDDGPGKYTEDVLNILDKYDIKATFFVTNQFPKYQYLIKQEYEKGHAIGVHTYSHKWSIYKDEDTYLADFNKIENIIYEQTGIHTKLFRFPGGSSNTISRNYHKGIMTHLTKLMTEKGYIYFDWTFDSGDTNKKDNSKEYIIKSVKANLKGDGHYVILMHDIQKNTIEALPEIIEYALANGYSFAKLTEDSPTEHFKIAN